MSSLGPGQIIGGKYLLERELGNGAMGVVYAATNTLLGHRVAIKAILPSGLPYPAATQRFLREAQAAVRIQSEHVARVLDLGQLDNGAHFIVMEFLEGFDLADALRKHGPVPPGLAVDWVLQACDALAEAHALGIVHRDLKPSNLFVARRNDGSSSLKVLDFGISKMQQEQGAASLTGSQSLLGSPGYMSPEQIRNPRLADPRTDIWALGATLQELLSGVPAFGSDAPSAVLARVVTEEPPSLLSLSPGLPPELGAVVSRCLQKDLSKRYQTIAALAEALMPWAPPGRPPRLERMRRFAASSGSGGQDEVPSLVAPLRPPPGDSSSQEAAVGPPIVRSARPAEETAGAWSESSAGARPMRARLALAALAALLVVGAAALAGWRHVARGPASASEPIPSAMASAPTGSPVPARDPAPSGPGDASLDAPLPDSAHADANLEAIDPSSLPTVAPPTVAPPTATAKRPPPVPTAVSPTPRADEDPLDLGKRR